MNSIWLSLLWKEWREQCWKLAALTGILSVVPLLALWGFAEQKEPDRVLVLMLVPAMSTIPYVVIAGLFVAMSVAAGENSRRTMRFVQATPAPMWEAALVKLMVAITTVVVPILIVVGTIWLIVSRYDSSGQLQLEAVQRLSYGHSQNYYLWQIVTGALGTTSLLIWGAAAGVNCSDEVRAGAVGFLVVTGVGLFCATALWIIHQCTGTMPDGAFLLIPALPGGLAFLTRYIVNGSTGNIVNESTSIAITLWSIGIIGHAVVLAWFLRQFGRVPLPPKRGVAGEWNFAFWRSTSPLPLRTPLGAIIWKQTREIGPLALFAIVGVVCCSLLLYWINGSQAGLAEFSQALTALTISVGILVTLVAGVGVLLEDYQPRVNTFWRSRPINPHLWCITKYLTGVAILAAAFGPLPIVLNWLSGWRYTSPQETIGAILLFLAIYTLSLTAYALVRQPIYAVILAVGSLWPIGFLDAGIAYELSARVGPDVAAWVAGTLLVLAFAAVLILAWQAVVRDWGWKHGR